MIDRLPADVRDEELSVFTVHGCVSCHCPRATLKIPWKTRVAFILEWPFHLLELVETMRVVSSFPSSFAMEITEKHADEIAPVQRSSGSIEVGKLEDSDDNFEVFKKQDGVVDFRTVGWIQASVIFLKSEFQSSTFETNLTQSPSLV